MKVFKDLKVGDTVGILGWHRMYGEDETEYGIILEKIINIELYNLHPSVTGMIKSITTSNRKVFKDVSKNRSIATIDNIGSNKYIMYIDQSDITRIQREIRLKRIERLESDKKDIDKEIEELKNKL